jgi:hypothetical protein
MFIKGQREAIEFAEVEKERQLLGMVQAQGQVQISDVALELDGSRDQVKAWVYDLVHKGLFAGYINWDDGTLYSRDAAQLRRPNCAATSAPVAAVNWNWPAKAWSSAPFAGQRYS